MGVIQRQSLKYTAVNFIGTFIGFLSVVFIYPLDIEIYGDFQAIFGFAVLLVPLLGFGIQAAIVKFYPIFVQKKRGEQFLSFTLTIATVSAFVSTIILSTLYLIFEDQLRAVFDNFQLIEKYLLSIMVLSYILLYSSIFLYHSTARYRIVIPDIINTVGLKIFLPLMILILYLGYLPSSSFIYIVLGYFMVVALILFLYVKQLDKHEWRPDLKALDKQEYKAFVGFMGFAVLNGMGANFALKIDIAMIGAMISAQAVAIYAIIVTISNVMEIPSKALNQIASPVISSSWANDNKKNIQDVYQKSSVFGLIGGIFLFLIIFFIWVDIIHLMPGKFQMDISTVLTIFALLSFARITDLVTGVNSIIISYSKDYKYHMYFLVVLGLANVVLNYILMKKYGLVGAALATSISYVLFNIVKHFFVKYRFGFDLSFTQHFYIVLAGCLSFMILWFLPLTFHPIVNMFIKSVITTSAFGFLIYWFNPGGEIRGIVKDNLKKIKGLMQN